jgi:hypothetical protein
MSRDLASCLLFLLLGGTLGIYCALAARREVRAGVARGVLGDYGRSANPLPFWTVIVVDVLASLMGFTFAGFGLTGLLVGR